MTLHNLEELAREIKQLRTENAELKALLHTHGIALSIAKASVESAVPIAGAVTKRSPIADKVSLFTSLFQGRPDVYARRWESKDGRAGYSPVCKNEWKPGVCLKPKGKCADCSRADYLCYDTDAIAAHLSGRCVLGIYPLLLDETCRFLAIDFDEEKWRGDVQMVAKTCRNNEIPCSVEISRSGNGAHLWIFFTEPVDAARARALGSAILTLAMKEHARLSFQSYDRMFPNQDTMPKGGFGNLIALPLQITASRLAAQGILCYNKNVSSGCLSASTHEVMEKNMNIQRFWNAVLEQDADAIRVYFHPDAYVNWHCSNEHFTVEEFIRANCEYPGAWDGEVEKAVATDDIIITVTRVYPRDCSASFHVTSFIRLDHDKIVAMDEYWADDGEAPKWRQDMKIGRKIK